jgi:glucokinase
LRRKHNEPLLSLSSDEKIGPGRPRLLRQVNATEILRLVHRFGPCSRADLSRASGLTPPTVSSSIEYLQKKGLVEAIGTGGSKGGRPPELVHFNRSFGAVVGVDIGGTALRLALAELDGSVLDKISLDIGTRGTPRRVVSMIRTGVSRLLKAQRIPRKKLIAIALGAPGIADFRAGVIRSAPHLPDWENVPLRRMVSEKLALPAVVENDVNLGALGESWCGTARAVPHFVFIGIGTGVGAGIFLNGQLYHGSDWMAGEVGYLTVPGTRSGPLNMAQPGPLESAVGGRGIEQAWRRGNNHRLRATEILDRAAAGQARARSILEHTAGVLAEGILNLSVVLNPQLVVFGGRIGTHPALFQATKRIFGQSRLGAPRLAMSVLGQEAQLLGAVWLATRLAEAQLLGRRIRSGQEKDS